MQHCYLNIGEINQFDSAPIIFSSTVAYPNNLNIMNRIEITPLDTFSIYSIMNTKYRVNFDF
jgi:hypothetical protein